MRADGYGEWASNSPRAEINYRNAYSFSYTITAREDPNARTLERLMELPHRDVAAQLYKAADTP
ncbi:hypothetical protein ACFZCL_41530 [Streptomyces sp. NPDC008159]|uniref:hypothetical protein n=1 Tax=Streptomyces sp. NPDC008159 TaxID=3364817 RepID=UPI0036ED569E